MRLKRLHSNPHISRRYKRSVAIRRMRAYEACNYPSLTSPSMQLYVDALQWIDPISPRGGAKPSTPCAKEARGHNVTTLTIQYGSASENSLAFGRACNASGSHPHPSMPIHWSPPYYYSPHPPRPCTLVSDILAVLSQNPESQVVGGE